MKQRWHPYTLWEDWHAGMYRKETVDHRRVTAAAHLLADPDTFQDTATTVTSSWVYATEHNLTDLSQNRRAWLGQASCTYAIGATSLETRLAWNGDLTDLQRSTANRVAERVIAVWYGGQQMEMRYA